MRVGAFTRRKGGVRRAPFLVDTSIDMRGHAFLTSSAANESAQESDRIAASFFTHYLLSGLRGAADANQDRRVTLQEAFQFASAETLARTERTQGGPQHAAYEFELTGTGDMVVTDVRGTQAGLVLTPELAGRITVREQGGALVAELRKPAGNTVELGLEPGTYQIAMEQEATRMEALVALASGQRADLRKLAFTPGAPREVAVARGDGPGAPVETVAVAAAPAAHTQTPVKLGFIPRDADATTDVTVLSFGLLADRAARLRGLQLSIGYNQTDEAMNGRPAHRGGQPGARELARGAAVGRREPGRGRRSRRSARRFRQRRPRRHARAPAERRDQPRRRRSARRPDRRRSSTVPAPPGAFSSRGDQHRRTRRRDAAGPGQRRRRDARVPARRRQRGGAARASG